MASLFGHGIVGFTIAKVIDDKNLKWLVLAAVCSAILPDFDVIAFKLGFAYEHPLGHRGFTHSILFAVLWALLLMLTIGKKNKLIWFLVICLSMISHGVFDAMTSGGKGVGFFIPFNNKRFFFQFRDILVSPLGVENFISSRGVAVLFSEFKYIFLPCFLVLGIRFLVCKLKNMYYNEI
ncbi:metal-dependent hydrolase [Algibacter pectinivorans]|uniref:Inner membrane protein n=1 Tax=Algibacter pectinivorans TaxID=870482 RepID=A0A1I1PPF3_9FLAO|nr:metal-dependent hydrolase [Algibacter pectinivorans]SFD11769.1 inner membrane protein [Algibacter pectinivorans]